MGVKCMIVGCRHLATHKVGEENIWDENDSDEKENYYNFEASHNATTYLCDEHFKFVMTRETEYNTIEDNRFSVIEKRKIGYYKVCHPYSMTEEAIGYWDGSYWKFDDLPDGEFDDDELQWIDEKQIKKQ